MLLFNNSLPIHRKYANYKLIFAYILCRCQHCFTLLVELWFFPHVKKHMQLLHYQMKGNFLLAFCHLLHLKKNISVYAISTSSKLREKRERERAHMHIFFK